MPHRVGAPALPAVFVHWVLGTSPVTAEVTQYTVMPRKNLYGCASFHCRGGKCCGAHADTWGMSGMACCCLQRLSKPEDCRPRTCWHMCPPYDHTVSMLPRLKQSTGLQHRSCRCQST